MKWSEWAPGEPGPGGGALRVAQVSLLVMALSLPFSIAVTEAALILGLIALVVSRARGRAFRTPETYLWPAAFAMLACWLLSTALSENRADSLFHVRKLYAMGLILLAAETARDARVRRRVIPNVLAGALFTAGIGLLIYAVRIQSKPDYRLQSVLSNQMTSGGVLSAAFLWAVAALAAGPWRRRWAYGLVAIPLAIALALTQTRSHWLGTAVGAGVIVIALAPRWWWTVPVTATLGVWLAPHRLALRLYSIVDPHEPGNQGRLSMWRSARDIIREHPMFGVGCQDLLSLYRRYRYPDWTFESGHFHNNFIQITVMTGMVGLVAFLFWLAAATRELARGMRSAKTPEDRGIAAGAAAIFAALLVSGMFDYTFGDAEVVYHTFLGLGLALALVPPDDAHAGHGA
jgi:O-antigen ligase